MNLLEGNLFEKEKENFNYCSIKPEHTHDTTKLAISYQTANKVTNAYRDFLQANNFDNFSDAEPKKSHLFLYKVFKFLIRYHFD
jgi:hypothetical protein